MIVAAAAEWHWRRSALNHDWLQNRYLIFLLALNNDCVNLSEPDRAFQEEAMHGLRDWEEKRPIILELFETAIPLLTPRSILSLFPLSRMNDTERDWLGAVAHHCWLARLSVADRVAHGIGRLDRANCAYKALLSGLNAPRDASFSCTLAVRLSHFHQACIELSQAISELPSRRDLL